MGVGTYGLTRPSDVSVEDIDMFYNFVPNREVENNEIFRLEPSELLTQMNLVDTNDEMFVSGGENVLEGLYNLRLPATIFNELGIYTIYIKPKSYVIEVLDCNTLSSLPTVRGLIIDGNDLPENLQTNNSLQGYRVEYLDDNNLKIRNLVRYIVSSNKVVPVTENVGNVNQQATRYRFDDIGNHIFLQVTPSSAPNIKPNQLPFIGKTGNYIKISNTYFSPLVIEIEMVENTIETLTNLLMGEQVKDVRKGIITYYDKDREIVKQYNLFTIKDDVRDVPLYEVRELRENVDELQNFNNIIDAIE